MPGILHNTRNLHSGDGTIHQRNKCTCTGVITALLWEKIFLNPCSGDGIHYILDNWWSNCTKIETIALCNFEMWPSLVGSLVLIAQLKRKVTFLFKYFFNKHSFTSPILCGFVGSVAQDSFLWSQLATDTSWLKLPWGKNARQSSTSLFQREQ